MSESGNTTRDRILQAALDLFLRQGIRKTSVDDVADRVGVSRVTVYRHFSDRQQLIGESFLLVNAVFDRV
ncbi:MAG: TetR/AcrR family transcriptional regulator, partial [Aeromicrobium sp.]